MALVDVSTVPKHVAIIMDGNGRWATQIGEPRPRGHREGSEAVRRTVRAARRLGVSALTLYAFSAQNWARPTLEVQALMSLLREFLESERDEILHHEIRLRTIGDITRLPAEVRSVLDPLVAESAHHQGMVLTLALSYGGREEIAAAARTLAKQAVEGSLDPNDIDVAKMESTLPSVCDVGPVDLLIRTGGEQRISNFVLWASAYAELYFSAALWPDYGGDDLYEAVAEYQKRNRRFGRVEAAESEPATVRDALKKNAAI